MSTDLTLTGPADKETESKFVFNFQKWIELEIKRWSFQIFYEQTQTFPDVSPNRAKFGWFQKSFSNFLVVFTSKVSDVTELKSWKNKNIAPNQPNGWLCSVSKACLKSDHEINGNYYTDSVISWNVYGNFLFETNVSKFESFRIVTITYIQLCT